MFHRTIVCGWIAFTAYSVAAVAGFVALVLGNKAGAGAALIVVLIVGGAAWAGLSAVLCQMEHDQTAARRLGNRYRGDDNP